MSRIQESGFATVAIYMIIAIITLALPLSSQASVVPTAVMNHTPSPSLAQPYHYLVLSIEEGGVIEPLFHRLVQLHREASPLNLGPMDADESPVSRPGAVVATVVRRDGKVVARDVLTLELHRRGEFHGTPHPSGGWEIDAHHLPLESAVFVVRVPRIPGASLRLEHGAAVVTMDLDRLESEADRLPLAGLAQQVARLAVLGTGGNPGNRVDLLVMGDGYTSTTDFDSDAAALVDEFFTITPYHDYLNHVNVQTLFSLSVEAGADHPPFDPDCPVGNLACCADLEASVDPLSGTYVDTAFDGRFCDFNIHRLAVVDVAKVLAAASSAPDWDRILVLLHDSTYGGSGGVFSVSSTHPLAVDIARHEYGHSFTGLADEYDTPFPGFPACSDVTEPQCEPNVTDETIPALIKWEPWIDVTTPIPTPEGDPRYVDDVGLFEGARYLATGMYRPRDFGCLMNLLGQPFGEICAQTYVLRLHTGGWGVPSAGIDPIEPGSENPPPGLFIIAPTETLVLSVSLLQPFLGPPLNVSWWVDGEAQPGADGDTFVFDPPVEGIYGIEVRTTDTTSLVHPEMAGGALDSQRWWTVGVSSGDLIFADGFESGGTSVWTEALP